MRARAARGQAHARSAGTTHARSAGDRTGGDRLVPAQGVARLSCILKASPQVPAAQLRRYGNGESACECLSTPTQEQGGGRRGRTPRANGRDARAARRFAHHARKLEELSGASARGRTRVRSVPMAPATISASTRRYASGASAEEMGSKRMPSRKSGCRTRWRRGSLRGLNRGPRGEP